MSTLAHYKATRPNGRDFYTGTVDYAAALASGDVIRHTAPKMVRDDASTYLSVSVSPTDCMGFSWPCRLFRVEPVGEVMDNLSVSPSKRACSALRVVEELPAWQVFGPQGQDVVAVIERAGRLTPDEAKRLAATLDATRTAARDAALAATLDATRTAAWDATWAATLDATRTAAWTATRAATLAYLVRDLITPEQFQTLAGPWLSVIGEPVR